MNRIKIAGKYMKTSKQKQKKKKQNKKSTE